MSDLDRAQLSKLVEKFEAMSFKLDNIVQLSHKLVRPACLVTVVGRHVYRTEMRKIF
jgi:hypothetical protein